MRLGILFFFFLVPTALFGGEVFGGVREGNNSVGPNVAVEIQCGNDRYSGQTDQYGTYRIYVPRPGPCTLRVLYKGQAPPPEIEIQSYADPQRYDLLVVVVNNRYVLRRT
jgi:hypothetical protein